MPTDKPRRRFQDIVENIDLVLTYVGGRTKEGALYGDPMRRDAIERAFERISEAASKLGAFAPLHAPNQSWADIRGIGNHLRHDYDGLFYGLIWKTITNDLGSLRADCVKAMEGLPDDQ